MGSAAGGAMGKPMSLRQHGEFVSVAVHCLPHDLDATIAQGWIDNPAGLAKVLREALVPVVANKFIAKDHFVLNVGNNDPVKVCHLSDSFECRFLKGKGKVEEKSNGAPLRHFDLLKLMSDSAIIKKLGGQEKAVVTLADVYAQMAKQPKGESGDLLNNGYGNIFYVLDQGGELQTVDTYWSGDGWSVCAFSVSDLDGWRAGSRAFSLA